MSRATLPTGETAPPSGRGRRCRNLLLRLLVLYPALILGFFYLYQDHLLFFPQHSGATPLALRFPHRRIERVTLTASDGSRLVGWLGRAEGPAPLILYFGGNGEDVADSFPDLLAQPALAAWHLLAMNYRGYGESTGEPSEAALVADGIQAHDHAAGLPGVLPGIAVMGRSLGSGVAVAVAAARPVRGVVLVTPYDSMVSVAAHHYPWLPVSLLLRHRFDSLALAPGVRCPALVLLAAADTVIPPSHGEHLGAAWGGPVEVRWIPGTGHINVVESDLYWRHLAGFLARLRPAPVSLVSPAPTISPAMSAR